MRAPPAHRDVRADQRVAADLGVVVDDAVGQHADVRTQRCVGRDHGAGHQQHVAAQRRARRHAGAGVHDGRPARGGSSSPAITAARPA
ncbi:MAG: hypothetical protein MZU95_07470 [Desulfomicrobium escambiense]|nr:hypothetical protein [Desulfomicrobium escambiense]